MTTKSERNLEEELGPSPNPFFAKKDEPWKDAKVMLKLDKKHDYQYEIAHVLGISASKVSYWMDKAYDNYEPEPDDEALECEYYPVCGNETPGASNGLCTECLDLLRQDDSGTSKEVRKNNPDLSKLKLMKKLRETYPDLINGA
ncbi:hypothetical protein [Halomonas sp.]|uniref:hypothetical protein n=1 Tax=Halomonas sp. TaxID=1486246 RepID=UPI0035622BF9